MQTCSLQRKLVKQVTRTSQLVYSDEHARLSILKVVKHATLPDNINEAGLRMRDYADTLKRAIDGRQYAVGAALQKRRMGKYISFVKCRILLPLSQILL
jgi:hypothetical protein